MIVARSDSNAVPSLVSARSSAMEIDPLFDEGSNSEKLLGNPEVIPASVLDIEESCSNESAEFPRSG